MKLQERLERIEFLLDNLSHIITKGYLHMNDQITAIIAAFDANTTQLAGVQDALVAETVAIKTEIDGLVTQLAAAIAANTAPTQAQLDALTALSARQAAIGTSLASTSAALTALGANGQAPAPVAPVAPATPAAGTSTGSVT